MRRYLSVDIDFWNGDERRESAWYDLNRLFTLARKKGIPIHAVMNHQQLLKHVDASRARELVNLDTHSDLSSVEETTEFNCGTWVSFVRWRHRGIYRWLHMGTIEDGECSWDAPIFMSGRTRGHLSDWKRITRRKIKGMPNLSDLLRNCTEIGFVMSPAYSDERLEKMFRRLVKKYNIPYTKGVVGEDEFRAIRRPPYRRIKK